MLLCRLTDKDLHRICRNQYEHPGSAIGYWLGVSLCHVYIVLEPVGSPRLTFGDGRCYEFMCFDVLKVVRSSGWDRGHDEESQNGRDVNIDILDDYIRTPEVFRNVSGTYRSAEGLPEPPGEVLGLSGPEGWERVAAQEVAPPHGEYELD